MDPRSPDVNSSGHVVGVRGERARLRTHSDRTWASLTLNFPFASCQRNETNPTTRSNSWSCPCWSHVETTGVMAIPTNLQLPGAECLGTIDSMRGFPPSPPGKQAIVPTEMDMGTPSYPSTEVPNPSQVAVGMFPQAYDGIRCPVGRLNRPCDASV